MNQCFSLYSNCVVTKGHKRSILSDLQRMSSIFILNDMVEILEYLENMPIIEVKRIFGKKNERVIDEYINFLIEREYGFLSSEEERKLFPKLPLTFYSPARITNAVVEIDKTRIQEVKDIMQDLSDLGCRYIYFFSQDFLEENIYRLLDNFAGKTKITSMEIMSKYDEKIDDFFIEKIVPFTGTVTKLIFHSVREEIKIKLDNYIFEIQIIKSFLTNFKFCGTINDKSFTTNMDKYLESVNHNSCLHKKIAIDKDGNIKNCPVMPQNFGNIHNSSLKEALNHPDFKKYWNVTKDQIYVCKDCEFRHICTDCRAFTERNKFKNKIDLSKPLKCGYNPYTNKWEEWSNNPLKQKNIEYYQIQELIKNV